MPSQIVVDAVVAVVVVVVVADADRTGTDQNGTKKIHSRINFCLYSFMTIKDCGLVLFGM